MIIDDQATERRILETIIKTVGHNISIVSFDNAREALRAAEEDIPDLILTDYKMPDMDGIELIRSFRENPLLCDIPIVVVTIVDDKSVLYDALDAGATDFLCKPIDHYQCKVRCRNLLNLRRQQTIIRERAASLEKSYQEQAVNIRTRESAILYRLARAAEFRDVPCDQHFQRVGILSRRTAEVMGLPEDFCNTIEQASVIHDIGKVGIPETILNKTDALTDDERRIVQRHTWIGYQILKNSESDFLDMGAIIALNHHERFDGQGYPNNLSGNKIPIEARIVAVVDVYDALTSSRSYRKAWNHEDALEYLKNARGKEFDPDCIDAFISIVDEVSEPITRETDGNFINSTQNSQG